MVTGISLVAHFLEAPVFIREVILITASPAGGDSWSNKSSSVPQDEKVEHRGVKKIIPAEEVITGDRLIVKTGGKIAADASVISGSAVVDEALQENQEKWNNRLT